MTAKPSFSHVFSKTLVVQAAWPAAVVVIIALLARELGMASFGSLWWHAATILAVGAVASGLATLVLSANLLFDAYLFRMIASHASVAEGCAAVDDLLARLRLKPRPTVSRVLDDRIAGTRRLIRWQRAALGLFVAAAVAAGLARTA